MDQRAKIAILGYGIEGKSTIKHLIDNGFNNITVCDRNVDLKEELPDGVSAHLGEHYLNDLDEFDVLFRSPGIRCLDPHIQAAKLKGTKVSSQTSYFLDQCPAKIVGVTGTNGKGTTSTLIKLMLEKKYGNKVFLGGNIGVPPLDFLDKLTAKNIVVLELSSFQLQDLEKSPSYAVFLNTTSDHLDYHTDNSEYLQAKEGILANQNDNDVVILNIDYEYSKYYKPLVKGLLLEVSSVGKVQNGAYIKNGVIYYVKNGESDEIFKTDKVLLKGSHNFENILSAICVAKDFEVSNEDIKEVLSTFKGLEHRLEFVKELNDVKFYNDSFSTTPYTSMAAIDSFDQDIVLIAGGYDKGADYSDWAIKILTKANLRTVVLIGDLKERMEEALFNAEKELGEAEGSPTKILKREDFEDAILSAYMEASNGGIVLLSPAAASFGMFKNAKERGLLFKENVMKLK